MMKVLSANRKCILAFSIGFLLEITPALATTQNIVYGPYPPDSSIFVKSQIASAIQTCPAGQQAIIGTNVAGVARSGLVFLVPIITSPMPSGFSCTSNMTFTISFPPQQVCISGLGNATRSANSVGAPGMVNFTYQQTSTALSASASNPCSSSNSLPFQGCGQSLTSSNLLNCCYSDTGTGACNFA